MEQAERMKKKQMASGVLIKSQSRVDTTKLDLDQARNIIIILAYLKNFVSLKLLNY